MQVRVSRRVVGVGVVTVMPVLPVAEADADSQAPAHAAQDCIRMGAGEHRPVPCVVADQRHLDAAESNGQRRQD